MRKFIGIGLLLIWLPGCVPLLVGGVVGYEMSKSDAKADAQHKEKMDLERAKLANMDRQVELEKARAKK